MKREPYVELRVELIEHAIKRLRLIVEEARAIMDGGNGYSPENLGGRIHMYRAR